MRKLRNIFFALLITTQASCAQEAVTAEKKQATLKFIDVVGVEEYAKQSYTKVFAVAAAQAKNSAAQKYPQFTSRTFNCYEDKMKEIFEVKYNTEMQTPVKNRFVKTVASQYSLEELDSINRVFDSEIGKKIASRQGLSRAEMDSFSELFAMDYKKFDEKYEKVDDKLAKDVFRSMKIASDDLEEDENFKRKAFETALDCAVSNET